MERDIGHKPQDKRTQLTLGNCYNETGTSLIDQEIALLDCLDRV